jgi:hypothetical protein
VVVASFLPRSAAETSYNKQTEDSNELFNRRAMRLMILGVWSGCHPGVQFTKSERTKDPLRYCNCRGLAYLSASSLDSFRCTYVVLASLSVRPCLLFCPVPTLWILSHHGKNGVAIPSKFLPVAHRILDVLEAMLLVQGLSALSSLQKSRCTILSCS